MLLFQGAYGLLALLAPALLHGVPSGEARRRPHDGGGGGGARHRTAAEVVAQLDLTANVEKGFFRQTFQDADTRCGSRSVGTAIYYLLDGAAGQSVWHRVDAVEVWHFYAGAPLVLALWNGTGGVRSRVLGPDVFDAQAPQLVVDRWEWQSARSLGNWTLVGTTVAPGFVTTGYELAPDGWAPGE